MLDRIYMPDYIHFNLTGMCLTKRETSSTRGVYPYAPSDITCLVIVSFRGA